MDRDGLGLWINNPHRPTAGSQPVLDLGNYFTRSIIGRKNFHRQIGSSGKKTLRQLSANAIGANEGRVRCSDRVRILGDLEAGLRSQDDTQASRFDKVSQDRSHFGGNRPVFRSGRRHHDEFSVYQFASAEVGRLEQFFGGRNVFDGSHTRKYTAPSQTTPPVGDCRLGAIGDESPRVHLTRPRSAAVT